MRDYGLKPFEPTRPMDPPPSTIQLQFDNRYVYMQFMHADFVLLIPGFQAFF
jgi:hypothetical protein